MVNTGWGVSAAIVAGTGALVFSGIFIILMFFGLKFNKELQAKPRNTIIAVGYQVRVVIALTIYETCYICAVYFWVYSLDDYSLSMWELYLVYSFACMLAIAIAVDKIGYQFVWMVSGSAVVTLSVLFFYWVNAVPQKASLFFLGLGNAAAITPGVSIFPYIFKKERWGRAYGCGVIAYSLGQMIAFSVSIFVDSKYYPFLSVLLAFVSLFLIFLLNIIDFRYGKIINKPRDQWRDVIWNKPGFL